MKPEYEDQHISARPSSEIAEPRESDFPYWPKSSLSLAFLAILTLIPPSQCQFPMAEENIVLRRLYAQIFAQAALTNVESEIDEVGLALNIEAGLSREKCSFHPLVPFRVGPVLALVVLAVYEYCQRGNVSRMRSRINQAVTAAMDMSLHQLCLTTSQFSEAERRAWWITVSIDLILYALLLIDTLVVCCL